MVNKRLRFRISFSTSTIGGMRSDKQTLFSFCFPTLLPPLQHLPHSSRLQPDLSSFGCRLLPLQRYLVSAAYLLLCEVSGAHNGWIRLSQMFRLRLYFSIAISVDVTVLMSLTDSGGGVIDKSDGKMRGFNQRPKRDLI
ncbi:hypothetical protein TNCV_3013111 [Trichonephila clavipes]|nr:hypothetical protein TNCV_3013111 [Trichonephila clavipes]